MLFTHTLYIGIDLTARRPIYAALDADRRLTALSCTGIEELLAFLAGQPRAFVALNAPPRLNQGLMKQEQVRTQRSLPPLPVENADLRLADYLLRQAGFRVPSVPGRLEDAPLWMQRGFAFYARLEKMGWQPYPGGEAACQWLETNAQAVFAILLGSGLLPPRTLEGRLQRQLILFEQGVNLTDPMEFFEEITRRKLLHGLLPVEMVYTTGQLEALAAAYLAWLAASHAERVTGWGDAREGMVFLPVSQKEKAE